MNFVVRSEPSLPGLVWTEIPDPCPQDLLDQGWDILDTAERERANRFSHMPSREMYILGRLVTKRTLSQELGLPPREILFSYSPAGKPYLALYPHFHFNISHSGRMIAFLSSRLGPVGVDVEEIRDRNCLELARSFFSSSEVSWLEKGGLNQVNERFFKIWTQKESYLKGTGEGLPGGLTHYTVPCVSGETELNGFVIANFTPSKGFMGAVALPLLVEEEV